MGVIEKEWFVQPLCNDCGVALCWGISFDEYEEYTEFWDNWRCRDCNPNYEGSYEKFKKSKDVSNKKPLG